jgi:hypothetical protein
MRWGKANQSGIRIPRRRGKAADGAFSRDLAAYGDRNSPFRNLRKIQGFWLRGLIVFSGAFRKSRTMGTLEIIIATFPGMCECSRHFTYLLQRRRARTAELLAMCRLSQADFDIQYGNYLNTIVTCPPKVRPEDSKK